MKVSFLTTRGKLAPWMDGEGSREGGKLDPWMDGEGLGGREGSREIGSLDGWGGREGDREVYTYKVSSLCVLLKIVNEGSISCNEWEIGSLDVLVGGGEERERDLYVLLQTVNGCFMYTTTSIKCKI